MSARLYDTDSEGQPLVLAALVVTTLLAIYNQQVYRYTEVFDLIVSWRVTDLTLLLVCGAFGIYWVGRREWLRWPPYRTRGMRWAFYAFAAVGTIAIARGFVREGTWAIGMGRYTMAGALLLVPILVRAEISARAFAVLLRAAVVAMLLGWFIRFVPDLPQIVSVLPSRFYSDVESYSAFAYAVVTLGTGLVVLAPLFSVPVRASTRMFMLVVTGVSVVFLLLAQHRSVWLSMFAGGLSVAWSSMQFSRREGRTSNLLAYGIGFALAVLVGLVLFGSAIQELLNSRLVFLTEGYAVDSTANWRMANWTQKIAYTLETNPLWGAGFVPSVEWRAPNGELLTQHAHNSYVDFLGAAGLVGVFLYFALIVMAVISATRLEKEAPAELRLPIVASRAMVLMSAVFMFFYAQSILFWFAIGFIFVLDRLVAEDVYVRHVTQQLGAGTQLISENV